MGITAPGPQEVAGKSTRSRWESISTRHICGAGCNVNGDGQYFSVHLFAKCVYDFGVPQKNNHCLIFLFWLELVPRPRISFSPVELIFIESLLYVTDTVLSAFTGNDSCDPIWSITK